MRICTCTLYGDDTAQAITREAWDKGARVPEDYADYIWQEQPTVEAAIARHDEAMDLMRDEQNAGKPDREFY